MTKNKNTFIATLVLLTLIFSFDTAQGAWFTFKAKVKAGSATLLRNMWNGTRTDGGFPGGSQIAGGVDDYNNSDAAPSNRYATSWTVCTADDTPISYCGTGLASADAKDNATGLIWSLPCNGAGCDSFSDASPMTYRFSTNSVASNWSTVRNAYLDVATTTPGIYTFCGGGDHGEVGWSAPHQKQLMQAYIDGSYGNLEAGGVVDRDYWSATTLSDNPTYAWNVFLSSGSTILNTKVSNSNYVRCIRE